LYWVITFIMVAVLALLACVVAFIQWRTLQTIGRYENQVRGDAIRLASTFISERIARFDRLAKSIASSPQFMAPQDQGLDSTRFKQITSKEARRIAHYDSATSWLPSPWGPPNPIVNVDNLPRLSTWQVTRGLPIRAQTGKLLARSRRLLAEQIISSNPDILDIGEVDSLGGVVFLVPYKSQVKLAAFNLSRILAPGGGLKPGILSHTALAAETGSGEISFLVPMKRSGETRYLILSVGGRVESDQSIPEQTPFGLFNRAHQLIMYSGERQLILQAAQERAGSNLTISSIPYELVVPQPKSPAFMSVAGATAWIAAVVLSAFVVFNLLLRQLLVGISTFQWKLDNVQKHVQKKVQDLAHDFQNRIFALRTLMNSISGRLTFDQLQRLSGALDDLGGYTDHLSVSLVPDAFALPDVPGAPADVKPEVSTYLRGTVEVVAQQQAAMLKHPIRVEFAADFGSDEPFVAISRADLTRILSNLLGNAVEACSEKGTHGVAILVSPKGDEVCIQVTDDGCGIPEQKQRLIFQVGYSTKGTDRGKGLTSCVELARKWEAMVSLKHSAPGTGTAMELRVRRRPAPRWFVNSITLTGRSVLVVVDDEGEVFQYWTKAIAARLAEIGLPGDLVPTLLSVSGPSELRQDSAGALSDGTLFLVDYKFKEEQTTGIQLIEELHLESKAILVTNHFEQADVIEAVERLRIRLLPKTYMLNAKFPIDIGGGQ
jgi:signal transduction histidine kinase